ncbi:MAG: asparaginase [Salinigranum sp.]
MRSRGNDPTGEPSDVHLLATGGTIANPPDREGYLSGRELLEGVPEVEDVAPVSVTDVASRASSAISADVWFDLLAHVNRLVADPSPPSGIVVTHGSNTMEETAYFLHLTARTEIPIVLTAAQRNRGTVGNDGDRNLVDAVRVAAHEDAGGRGVLVVVNDQVHSARDVTKTVSGRPDAWTSGDFGPVGLTDKYGLVQFYRRIERRHTVDSGFDVDPEATLPEVEIVYTAAGAGGGAVEDALARGVDGIVLAAFPTGSPARPSERDGQEAALEAAAERGTPVVVSHRGLEGWPARRLRADERFVWGDTLTPQKARVLLSLCLLETTDVEEIQRRFLTY